MEIYFTTILAQESAPVSYTHLDVYKRQVLVYSHLLHEVELMADDIGILNHGHLLFEGTKEELKTRCV